MDVTGIEFGNGPTVEKICGPNRVNRNIPPLIQYIFIEAIFLFPAIANCIFAIATGDRRSTRVSNYSAVMDC